MTNKVRNNKLHCLKIVLISMQVFYSSNAFAVKNISEVYDHVSHLVTHSGVNPNEVVVIFDVDGTLTASSNPADGKPLAPRGKAIQVVKGLSQMGVHLVASSAWDEFGHTQQRISGLGLSQEFGMTDNVVEKNVKYPLANQSGNISVTVHKSGNVISVQDPDVDPTYRRQKALAPYFSDSIKEKIAAGKIKRVLFVDDSGGNVNNFKTDVARFGLYPGAQIEYFKLDDPSLDPKSTDPLAVHRAVTHLRANSEEKCPPPAQPLDELEAKMKSTLSISNQTAAQSHEILTSPVNQVVGNKAEAVNIINTLPMGSVVYWPSSKNDGTYKLLKRTKYQVNLDDAVRVDTKAEVGSYLTAVNQSFPNKEAALEQINTLPMGSVAYWPSSKKDGSFGILKRTKPQVGIADAGRANNQAELSPELLPVTQSVASKEKAIEAIQTLPMGSVLYWPSSKNDGSFGILKRSKPQVGIADAIQANTESELNENLK